MCDTVTVSFCNYGERSDVVCGGWESVPGVALAASKLGETVCADCKHVEDGLADGA